MTLTSKSSVTRSLKALVAAPVRLCAILAAALLPLPAAACIWGGTHNSYLFSLYDRTEFRDRTADVCNSNWKAYLGLPADEWFYFDADEVAAAARKKGDALMASYVEQLRRYLDCADEVSRERWDYPTKEQLAQRRQTLREVRAYAEGKLRSRLRSQHALLLMRCNMLLGRHAANVTFWEQTASRYIETVYKDMMHDIYAGALLHTGRSDEAGQHFAALGDWQSLMTQYYLRRSFQAISAEYDRDPASAVLPFLLQDFVNNAQEATDVYEEGWGVPAGKLFVRTIQESEAMQMCQLARRAVGEGRSPVPVMWQSALAWLEYLFGNELLARADIARTAAMEGTQRMKDCARVLRLFISTATETKGSEALDARMAAELQWLDSLSCADVYFFGAKDRLVHQVLQPLYAGAGRTETALALMGTVSPGYVQECIDTMSIASLHHLIAYVHSCATTAAAPSPVDRYAAASIKLDSIAVCDLIGTKHMRLAEWHEAQQWLARVPASYYREKGYAPYAAYRQWTVEPWMRRQWLKSDMAYAPVPADRLGENPKLAFAREMETLAQDLSVLTKESFCERCYDLAVRYAQCSYNGDCWYLTHDGKSINDTLRTNEADLLGFARDFLRKASQTSNPVLKRKALFALSYGGLYSSDQTWREFVWSDELLKFVVSPRPATEQYQALARLDEFSRQQGESDYVSRCDEYKQFRKSIRE